MNGNEIGWTGDGTARRANYPLIISSSPSPGRVLVPGPSTGAGAAAALAHGAARVDVVLENPVLATAWEFFTVDNRGAWKEDAVFIHAASAVEWARKAESGYDVIIAGLDSLAGAKEKADDLTLENFQNLSKLLGEGGVMAQWVSLASFSRDEIRTIIATFLRAFPNVTAWSGDINPVRAWLLLLGSKEPFRLDPALIHRRLERVRLHDAMAEGVNTYSFLSFYINDGEGLSDLVSGVSINKAENPVIGANGAHEKTSPSLLSADNFFLLSLYRTPSPIRLTTDEAVSEKVESYFRARSKIIEGRKAGMTKTVDDELVWYDKALRDTPGDPHLALSYFAIGRARYTNGLLTQAAVILEKAKKISPGEPIIRFYLGKTYEKMKRYSEAAKEFKKLNELAPGYYQRPRAAPGGP
ncbi:MAG: hypothetical protein ACNS63_12975 [Candidatus Nitrospinota bacterium M3_3B_026]